MAKKATPAQLKEWKEKHGGGFILEVDDKVCYLRSPKMHDWKRAMSLLQEDGENALAESLLGSCWLGGDEEIKTNDSYFLSAKKKLVKLFEYPEAVVKHNGDKVCISIGKNTCEVRQITRDDLNFAEARNPSNKPFVTDEKLFDEIKISADKAFDDKNNAAIRFPLYKALDQLQQQKMAVLKKF